MWAPSGRAGPTPDERKNPMLTYIARRILYSIPVLFGCAIGIYSAVRQYSVFDYAATTFSFLGFAFPVFWLALMLQVAFTNLFLAWHVRIFYTSGLSSISPGHGFSFLFDRVQHLAIPVMTLA